MDLSPANIQMSSQANSGASVLAPVCPQPRCSMTIRLATTADIPFIDMLQTMHQPMLGWTPKKTLEGKIAAGHMLIAEDERKSQIGYSISQDRYMGRDDVGVVYQLNVLPVSQRHLVGATLVKTIFERAAYGCKLFCCWCAQDIAANYFWESIGFVPLAFRAGNRKKQRIHIFWQRRVRENDTTTPYWFPAETRGGMMNEARLVLPIPPGTHWRDAKPILLPALSTVEGPVKPKALPPTRPPAPPVSQSRKMAIVRSESKHLKGLPPGKAAVITAGGIRYIERGDYVPPAPEVKPKRAPSAPRAKNDPKHVAAARELRDRYLEQVNTERCLPEARGKYEVGRQLQEKEVNGTLLLPQQRGHVAA